MLNRILVMLEGAFAHSLRELAPKRFPAFDPKKAGTTWYQEDSLAVAVFPNAAPTRTFFDGYAKSAGREFDAKGYVTFRPQLLKSYIQ